MRSIGPKIWIEDQPWVVPAFGNFGIRMTVIQLNTEELMLISPVPLNEVLKGELEALGPVGYIIGPNSMHHLSLRMYHEAFPKAPLAAPLKLQKKRSKLPFQLTLEEGPTYPWSEEVETLLIDSKSKISEAVFYHKPSRTLILTDLLFNLSQPRTWIQKLAYSLNGVREQPKMSRLGRLFFNDHLQLKEKVLKIAEWDFEQVIVAHGDFIANNGKQKFLDSFRWLLT